MITELESFTGLAHWGRLPKIQIGDPNTSEKYERFLVNEYGGLKVEIE